MTSMPQVRTLRVHFQRQFNGATADKKVVGFARVLERTSSSIDHITVPGLDDITCASCESYSLKAIELRKALRPEYNRICYRLYKAATATDTVAQQTAIQWQHAEFKRIVMFLNKATTIRVYDDVDLAPAVMFDYGRKLAQSLPTENGMTQKEVGAVIDSYVPK